MDLPWGGEKTVKFVTNIGLVTSNGPFGPDIMSAEWTHQISYSPGLIAVFIRASDATYENIKKTNEFGVNLCATDQTTLASVAGNYTGKDYDKIGALKELGFEFYQANKINVPMVKGAAMNAECKVIKSLPIGDHVMFVGEVIEASNNAGKESLAYYKGKFWTLENGAVKPSQKERDGIRGTVEKFHKK